METQFLIRIFQKIINIYKYQNYLLIEKTLFSKKIFYKLLRFFSSNYTLVKSIRFSVLLQLSHRPGARRTTYLNQISSHIRPGEKTLEANEIRKMSVKKSKWNQLFFVSKNKKPPDRSSQPEWWWWWWRNFNLKILFKKFHEHEQNGYFWLKYLLKK